LVGVILAEQVVVLVALHNIMVLVVEVLPHLVEMELAIQQDLVDRELVILLLMVHHIILQVEVVEVLNLDLDLVDTVDLGVVLAVEEILDQHLVPLLLVQITHLVLLDLPLLLEPPAADPMALAVMLDLTPEVVEEEWLSVLEEVVLVVLEL
jgi:hypothetical protein